MPLTHHEVKKGVLYPLLSKSRKRGSIGSLFSSKPVTYENDKGRNSSGSNPKLRNNHNNNFLEVTKFKLKHYKRKESPLRSAK